MSEINSAAKAYLETDDAFTQAQLLQKYPTLEEDLQSPEIRTAILDWLQSDDAWTQSSKLFTFNCIEFLRTLASEEESTVIRPFLLHDDHRIRLATYEFLRALYYPDKNSEAMSQLYQIMLLDNGDIIRMQAARYVKQAGAVAQLKPFLQRWCKTARKQGWENSESYELISQMLEE